ncbi:MAG: type III restriction enzyme [Paracoccaceae bacterium]
MRRGIGIRLVLWTPTPHELQRKPCGNPPSQTRSKLPDGSIVADIVDPHGIHLSDALPKLKGLARYAEKFGKVFRRVDAIAKIGETFRVLDLTEASVRAAVEAASSIKALYESKAADDYILSGPT